MRELSVKDLCRTTDKSALNFKSTAELPSLNKVIGQERAVRALKFGIEMLAPGYNVFVGGLPNTGKSTIVTNLVQRFAASKPAPPDWILVFNFQESISQRYLASPLARG